MKYSKKGLAKRKKEREGYAEFFQRHIQIIKDTKAVCDECGSRLKGDVSEVAHVLPKGTYKSVATNDNNVVYLCGQYSTSQCHTNFDTLPAEKIKEMLVFNKISSIFAELKNIVTEKITHKIYGRYTKEEH